MPPRPASWDKGIYEYFQFPIVNVYEKLAPNLGNLPHSLIDYVIPVYSQLLNIQHAADHFVRHVDVSRETLINMDRRVVRLSNRIERAAPKLAEFAGFTIPDDYFCKLDASAKKMADELRAAMARAAAADPNHHVAVGAAVEPEKQGP